MIKEISKPQLVRVFDVGVLGPFMIYAGARKSDLPAWIRIGIAAGGVLTMGYNAYYFWINRNNTE